MWRIGAALDGTLDAFVRQPKVSGYTPTLALLCACKISIRGEVVSELQADTVEPESESEFCLDSQIRTDNCHTNYLSLCLGSLCL